MQSRSVVSFVLGVFFLACGAAAGDGAGDPTADAGTPTTDADTPSDSSVQTDAGRADVVTGPTVGLDRAAQLVGETLCGFHERCFQTYVRDFFPSLSACSARYAAAFKATHAPDALFAEADLATMATCEAKLTCDGLYGGTWQTACPSPRPVNARAEGAPCVSDVSCASETCVATTPGACGTCRARDESKAGEACGEGQKRCAKGLTCLSSKRCVAVRALGETCDTSTALCGNGLTCQGGTCAKLPAAGEACDARGGCDPYRLAGCGTDGQCAAVTNLAKGATCELGALATCGSGETCTPGDGGATGTCIARKPAGTACRRSQECEIFATCTGGTCADPKGPACR